MRISDIFTDEIIDADIRKMMGKNAPKIIRETPKDERSNDCESGSIKKRSINKSKKS
jgi:hypothetical protein